MRTYLDCIPCCVRQALDASRMVTDDVAVQERVLRETLALVNTIEFHRPPPWLGQQIHRFLKTATGDADPYREAKHRSNRLARELYPRLEEAVHAAADPFAAAIRFAIAGNTIDFGVKTHITDADVREAVHVAETAPLDEAVLTRFRRAIESARDILYLADNAGEILFDRLLIERLPTNKLAVVVRGQPIINDATREDAEAAGLPAIVEVIDNGSDVPGTIPELCSPAFRERLARCDLLISKGQGNYETLDGIAKRVFFLLRAKCPVIARHIGCEIGCMVLYENGYPQDGPV
ncbi:MAG: DUF89 family protein [Phycisphaerae bacterium]|nr:DUF89 family protein [Phycisphaerae bacterium]